MIALLLLLQQASPPALPTVGDTIRIERVVAEAPGTVVRPQPWALGELGQQLGAAEVVQGPRGTVVRYSLVLWYPGEQTLTMPGPVLVHKDGSSDTLAALSYKVKLLSVLPAGEKRSTLAPKPARDPVPIVSRSLLPLALLLGFVLLGLAVAGLLWRRRGKAPPRRALIEVFPGPEVLRRWGAAGEYRAALDGWSWRLARRLARSRDLTEMAALQAVLDDIADQVYVPDAPERLALLCERASVLEPA